MKKICVLLVEDSKYSADLNLRQLKKAGFEADFEIVASESKMRKVLEEYDWDLILSDHSMPGFSSHQALAVRNKMAPRVPFVIVSEHIMQEQITQAFNEGCNGFVSKEDLVELRKVVSELM